MGSVFNGSIKLSVFGESHGKAIGVVLDGFPAGMKIDYENLNAQLIRRRPKRADYSTKRAEEDIPVILSGEKNGITQGSPLCMQIQNKDAKSEDYQTDIFRPSHADYTGYVRYNGYNDASGGGHFSGRITAAIVMAGALCRQYLTQNYGVNIFSHIKSIGDIKDKNFEYSDDYKKITNTKCESLEVFDQNAQYGMLKLIKDAASEGDSVGGIAECCALGVEAGLGSPMMQGIESRIAALMFCIPAVKAVQFGKGFEMCGMRGSRANDQIQYSNGKFITKTNNNGGILGGISNGMPVVFSVGIKPTPSISLSQMTATKEGKNIEHIIKGRHDACIVPRVLPVIESAAAVVLLDLYTEKYGYAKH